MSRLPPKEKATRPAGPSTATSRPGAWSGSPCSWPPRRRGVNAAGGRTKADGATRFCMGAAWREVRDNAQFDRVLEMIRGVKTLDLEACCTLGMLNADQARRLKEAGLDAYNHNLDSSEEFYDRIVSTRTYQDRLRTLDHVREAGISVCCGGVVRECEAAGHRVGLLHSLGALRGAPQS